MRKMSLLALTSLAVAGLSGMAVVPAATQSGSELRSASSSVPHEASPAKPQKSPSTRPGDTNGPRGWYRRSGSRSSYPKPGWSVRQGQRMARKRRNVLANRRAQR